MQKFKAAIQLIGINPYVSIPDKVLAKLFEQAKKDKGPVQLKGAVNGKTYNKTL